MAPLLSFLISSGSKKKEPRYVHPSELTCGSKKGTQIYFSFFSKVLANEPPLGSPTGPLWRGRPVYRAFCISVKNCIFRVPQKRSPSPRSPSWNSSQRDVPPLEPSFIHLLKSLVYDSPPPHIPVSPRMERGPHGERCPYPETFLAYLPGSPVKELPPRPPPWSLFRETHPIPRAPSSSSQSPR